MALIKGKNKAKITAAILLVVSFLFSEIKPASALLNSYNKPWNGTLSATEWNNLPLDFLNKDGAATLMGPLTIGSGATSSSLYIHGPITSPIGAPIISSGEFGSNASWGDFYFGASGPGNVGIGTTTASHKLTVQGDINFTGSLLNNGAPFTGSKWTQNGTSIFYDAGNVGIGTSGPLASLDIKGVGTSSATFAFNVQDSLGANKFRIQNNGQALVSNIAVTNLAEFGFLNDTNTGLDWITTDTVGLMAGGASRFSCSGAACSAAVPTTLTRLTTTLDVNVGTMLTAGRIGASSLILGGDPANNSLAALEAYGGVSAYAPPSGASIFYDTFSGGVTEQLPVHIPDTGTSWTMIIQNGASTASSRNTGFAGPTATVTDGGVLYTADANYTTADYEVSTYIQALTSSDDVLNLAVRIQDTDNMYVARISSSVTGIYRKVGGTWTLLGSATTYITAGNYVKLRVVGNVLSLYRGDSLLLTVSDSNITGAGKAGLGFGDIGIITTDDHSATWQVDNFSVKLYEDANLAALFMNGNVGIGLTNPAARLHIAPGANAGLINTGSTQLTALGGAGSVFVMADNDGNIFSSSTSAIITPIVTPIITTAGGWTASGTVVYKTDPNGNVGIGTTAPGAKFEVSGDIKSSVTGSSALFTAYNPGTNYPRALFKVGNSSSDVNTGLMFAPEYTSAGVTKPFSLEIYNNKLNADSSARMIGLGVYSTYSSIHSLGPNGNSAGLPLVFSTQTYLGNNPAIYISNATSQNVGIGTINPLYKLAVSHTGSTNVVGTMDFANTNNAYTQLRVLSDGVGFSLRAHNSGIGYISANSSLQFSNNDAANAGTLWLGNGNRLRLVDITGTNSYLTVNNAGNVGIGTSSPIAKLHVVGATGLINTGITQFTALGGVGNALVMTDNTGTLYSEENPTGTLLMPAGTSGATLRHDGTVWVSNTNLYNNGTNVGVGTSTPISKLDVIGSIKGNQFNIHNGSAYIGGIGYESGLLAFKGGASLITRMAITWDGKVGIGTTNPGRTFHVNDLADNNKAAALIHKISSAGANSGLHVHVAGTTNSSQNYYIAKFTSGGSDVDNPLNTAMLIGRSGNVGIGTTSPIAKLHVVGADGLINTGITQFSALGGAGNVLVMADNTGTLYSETNPVGTALLPTGTNGQTLRHDGTAWLANTNLYNNGTNVGIGTSNPQWKLQTTGNLGAFNSDSTDHYVLAGVNDLVGNWRYAGIKYERASNVAKFGSYLNAGLGEVGYIAINNSGNVGIGTTNPLNKFSVVRDAQTTPAITADIMAYGNTSALIGARGNNSGVEFLMGVSTLGEAFIGSMTNHGMSLRTNNTNRLTVNTVGNVGIGTTSPIAKLHVVGADGLINTGITQFSALGGAGNVLVMADNTGTLYSEENPVGTALLPTGTNGQTLRHDGTAWLANTNLYNNGTNVGIGTSNPTSTFEIFNSSSSHALTLSANDANIRPNIRQIALRPNASGIAYNMFEGYIGNTITNLTKAGVIGVLGNVVLSPAVSTVSYMYFGAETNTAYNNNTFRLYPNKSAYFDGNVGIGTTAPDNLLTVSKDQNAITRIQIENPNSGVSAGTNLLFTKNGVSQAGNYFNNSDLSYKIANYVAGDMFFSTSNIERMRILAGGNVGIGTTSPIAKLHVVGADGLINTGATQLSALGGAGNVLVMADNTGTLYSETNPIGTALLPAGTNGQTLRHDGTAWLANTNLYNNGTNVGIGTTNPGTELEVLGQIKTPVAAAEARGLIWNDATSGAGGIVGHQYLDNGADYGMSILFNAYKPGNASIERLKRLRANYYPSRLSLSAHQGGFVYQIASAGTADTDIVDWVTRFAITNTGNVGIGTTNPGAKLSLYESDGTNIVLGNYASLGTTYSSWGTVLGNNVKADEGTGQLVYMMSHPSMAGSAIFLQGNNINFHAQTGSSTSGTAFNSPRMRISGDGNVGIGLVNPSAQLEVAGSTGFINGGATKLSLLGGSGNVFIMADNTGTLYSTSTSAIVTPIVTSASGWTASGTTVYKTDVNGNVGIGTTAPNTRLHINGTVLQPNNFANSLHLVGSSDVNYDNTAKITIYGVASYDQDRYTGGLHFTRREFQHQGFYGSGIRGFLDGSSLYTNGLDFYTSTDGQRNVSRMYISSSGNIGVGTSSPKTLLEIYSKNGGYDGTGYRSLRLSNNVAGGYTINQGAVSSVTSYVGFNNYYNSSYQYVPDVSVAAGIKYVNGRLDLYNDSGLTVGTPYSPTERLSIISSGNVGIGTSSPIAKLHVVGADGLINTGATQLSALGGAGNVLVMADNAGGLYGVTSPEGTAILPSGTAGYTLRHDGTAWISNSNLFNSGTNVGIGTTNPLEKLHIVGNVRISGTLSTQTGSDFAEEFTVREEIEPGTVVVMAEDGYKSVKASRKAYDQTVVGVVSNSPSIVAGQVNSAKKAIVAMVGVVDVKVVNTNGSIKRGDLLTTSNVAGYAMRTNNAVIGTVIGKALEDMDGKQGVVKALINLQ